MTKMRVLLCILSCAPLLPAQQRPSITGIAQVRLYAASPAASDAFYSKVIGLREVKSGAGEVYVVNELQSVAVNPLPTPAPPTRMEAVVFRTKDAAGLQKLMTDHAIKIVQPLAHGTLGVHDPEGNLILFTEGLTYPVQASSRATSQRMIHAGLVVKDRDAEDKFYRDLLGFRVYWQGGSKDGRLDYVAMQVPDGTDWLEYMLNVPADANAHQLGGADHISLGLTHMPDAVAALQRNGCQGENCAKTQMGRDGKVQLNLFDPDLTRVEYMEYSASGTTCCSPILGKTPKDKEDR